MIAAKPKEAFAEREVQGKGWEVCSSHHPARSLPEQSRVLGGPSHRTAESQAAEHTCLVTQGVLRGCCLHFHSVKWG